MYKISLNFPKSNGLQFTSIVIGTDNVDPFESSALIIIFNISES